MAHDLEFKNILVIHFGQLGDVILGLPALRAIREHFADSKITLLHGKPPTAIVKLAHVADEYIPVDRVALRDGNKLRSIAAMLRLTGDIRRRSFDLVIDLHSLSETNILGFAAGVKTRLYAHRRGRTIRRLANFPVSPPDEDRSLHAARRYMRVLRPLGIEVEPVLTLEPSPESIEVAASIIEPYSDRKRVGMFLGAGHPSRRWPIAKYADLATRLIDEGTACFVFLGPEEAAMLPEIEAAFPSKALIFDKLSLLELFATFTMLDVIVGNDTGPMHLAAASKAQLILVSDELAPDEFLPLTPDLTVIRSGRIDEIEVDSVLDAVRKCLWNDISLMTC